MALMKPLNKFGAGSMLCTLMMILCAGTVEAQESPEAATSSHSWHLDAEALTDVPVHIGTRISLEGPWRLRGALAVGSLPEAYVNLINATSTSLDFYDQETADLIALEADEATDDVFVRPTGLLRSLAGQPLPTTAYCNNPKAQSPAPTTFSGDHLFRGPHALRFP